jgi:hypothetical protein
MRRKNPSNPNPINPIQHPQPNRNRPAENIFCVFDRETVEPYLTNSKSTTYAIHLHGNTNPVNP